MSKMKNSIRKKENKGRGPLARKIIDSARQELQKKVTSLGDWKEGKLRSEDYQKSIISKESLNKLDPLHALYIYSQNQLSVLIEQISEWPQLDKLTDIYARAEKEYLPSGPPMSPLTPTYFTSWGAFDLCSFGAKKETLCTVVTDFCKYFDVDHGQIEIFEEMQKSLLGKLGRDNAFITAVENDWLNYFDRNLDKASFENTNDAYHSLMKYGLNKNYWNEYIFLSYRNHRNDMILLEGFPDIMSSMPHAK